MKGKSSTDGNTYVHIRVKDVRTSIYGCRAVRLSIVVRFVDDARRSQRRDCFVGNQQVSFVNEMLR